jgi:hypothetical protein
VSAARPCRRRYRDDDVDAARRPAVRERAPGRETPHDRDRASTTNVLDASRPGVGQDDVRALHLIQQRGPCRPDVHQDGCFYVGLGRSTSLAIGADARVDRLIAGPAFDAAASRALAAGKVLVFDGIGVPLLDALVAALCARARLPLVRRAE